MENQKLSQIGQELKQKQIATIKEAVRLTLKKLNDLEEQRNILQDYIKIVKHDLFDLKDGRLDRILERQGLNEEAKKISVFVVMKAETPAGTPPWYENYTLCVQQDGASTMDCKVNNSVVKIYASGSYKLEDGSFKYL
jgi:hypothetical protein